MSPESSRIQIRWPEDWLGLIERECQKDGVSFASFVKMCVSAELKRRKVKLPEATPRGRPKKS